MYCKIRYQKNSKIYTETYKIDESIDLHKVLNNYQNIIEIKYFEKGFKNIFYKKKSEDILLLFKQLQMMLGAKLSFIDSLDLISQNNTNPLVNELILLIKNAVTQNKPIDEVLFKYEKILGKMVIVFLNLGIKSGTVKESVDTIVMLLDKEKAIKKKLIEGLRYPLFLMVAMLLAMGLIFFYVIPSFGFIFNQSEQDLPLATSLLVNTNRFFIENFFIILGGLISFIVTIVVWIDKGRLSFDKFMLHSIPVLSSIFKYYQLYKLFIAFYMIVQSKQQFQVALSKSIDSVTNLYLQKILKEIDYDMKQGKDIVHLFSRYKIFSPVFIKLLHLGETTNDYETVLLDITNYYQYKFENSTTKLLTFIEPLMILIIASFVLWLILAVMTPVWQMGAVGL